MNCMYISYHPILTSFIIHHNSLLFIYIFIQVCLCIDSQKCVQIKIYVKLEKIESSERIHNVTESSEYH